MLRSQSASIVFCGLSLLAQSSRAEGVLLFDLGDAVSVALTNEAPAVANGVRPEPAVAPLLPPVVSIPTTATRTYRTPDLDEAAPRIQPQRRPFVWL